MLDKIRGKARDPEDIRVGAIRERMAAQGYTVVSALSPEGAIFGSGPNFWRDPLPDHITSEHPAALRCMSPAAPLAALILSPIDDQELAHRSAQTLADFTGGPYRLGCDGVRLHVLRASGMILSSAALSGRVRFLHGRKTGPYGELASDFVPLDAAWPAGSLHETQYASLPLIRESDVAALVTALDRIPYTLADERRPAPKPSRSAFLGWSGR